MAQFYLNVRSDDNAVEIMDGKYDFTCITEKENNTILDVLNNVIEKFQENEYGIGLAFESESVVYKPKYVIEQIIIEYTNHSDNPLDYLAKGIAFSRKGAEFRLKSIQAFENYLSFSEHGKIPIINEKPIYRKRMIYYLMADLYEKENQLEKSLQYFEKSAQTDIGFPPFRIEERYATVLSKIDIHKAVDYLKKQILEDETCKYLETKLHDYEKKSEKGYIFKPRNKKAEVENKEIQQNIERLARRYLRNN